MVEILKLELQGFGKFKEKKEIKFSKGINFITGSNESGKSTILKAILSSLFKLKKPRGREYDFYNWDNKNICRTKLTYKTSSNKIYKVTSDYRNSSRKIERIIKKKSELISKNISKVDHYIEQHFGFNDQKVFENTAFIKQSQISILDDKIVTNKLKDMVEEVFVGSSEVSATKIIKKVKKESKDKNKEIKEISSRLSDLENKLKEADKSKKNQNKNKAKLQEIKSKLSKKQKKLKNLEETKKLYDKKEELLKEKKNKNEKIDNLKDALEMSNNENSSDTSKNKTLKGTISIIIGIILIIIGFLFNFILLASIISMFFIFYGIYKLKFKSISTQNNFNKSKIDEFKKKETKLHKELGVLESRLDQDKYKYLNFTHKGFQELNKLKPEVEELKEEKTRLKTEIKVTKGFSECPEEIKEDINLVKQKKEELSDKVKENDIIGLYLEKAQKQVQEEFIPTIEQNSKKLLKQVTDNKYSKLKINENDLNIKVFCPEIKEFKSADFLSQGAKDQVYFVIRTVMTDAFSGNIKIPLIFDDPFHSFDKNRLTNTISAIKEISENNQIILVSHRDYHKNYKGFAKRIIEV